MQLLLSRRCTRQLYVPADRRSHFDFSGGTSSPVVHVTLLPTSKCRSRPQNALQAYEMLKVETHLAQPATRRSVVCQSTVATATEHSMQVMIWQSCRRDRLGSALAGQSEAAGRVSKSNSAGLNVENFCSLGESCCMTYTIGRLKVQLLGVSSQKWTVVSCREPEDLLWTWAERSEVCGLNERIIPYFIVR